MHLGKSGSYDLKRRAFAGHYVPTPMSLSPVTPRHATPDPLSRIIRAAAQPAALGSAARARLVGSGLHDLLHLRDGGGVHDRQDLRGGSGFHLPAFGFFRRHFWLFSAPEADFNGATQTVQEADKCHHSQPWLRSGAIVDAPVRGDLQNILHHEGEFSCHCEIEGQELRLGPRSRKRVIPLRLQAERAENENVIVKGVKGTFLVETIPLCDAVKSIILDYLHLVLLGVVKQFYILWFTRSGTDWYIGRRKRAVTAYLKDIKRTYEVCRCTTDAKQWKLFKGSTWRTWLLFVSLPAFEGILKERYFQHWMLLVIGMSLLQEIISEEDLALADRLLSIFVRDYQELCCVRHMTYNLHCLSHLALVTRWWSSPWAVSAFKFESLNGTLTRLCHGTIRITTELSNTVNIITATNSLEYLMNEAVNVRMDPRITVLSPALLERLTNIDDVTVFRRVKIRRKIFTSTLYFAEKATDNKHVCYEDRGQVSYGMVQFYAKKGLNFYALIKKFMVEPQRQFQHTESELIVEHTVPVQLTNVYTAVIPVANILCKVFGIHGYVCKELNRFEHAL
ncbi:Cadmium/zinc-transporting ATPase HMA2 [Frankliniella fusca]|uniref:Cadmium/zinc-transporting ATPase HMA2 n=1 Tax=Frankliniella fusca TaxID=407009 RepID=A0AAE1HGE1_9NEOP|nr:Cadmium/zinc-transporting ATPase HMA2 [Frankliniella fusca]